MPFAFDPVRATVLLRAGSGTSNAAFRDGQQEAVRHVVEGRGRLLVVQKTGWGKSFVYFIACRLLREQGGGPALLVSPLLSLMRNQIAAAARMGVRAAAIHSDNTDEWAAVEQRLTRDEVDILLISPERLANERFGSRVLASIAGRLSMLVVDEAHCISDWGHDFRPEYRRLGRLARTLPRNFRLLATTATANDRVIADLADVLGPDLAVVRGDLDRPSLTLQTIVMPSQAERLAWLAEQVGALPGHGIVYALTVRDAEQVAAWLRSRGLAVEAYTGQSGDRREALEQALLGNRVKALVATTALGMGFDKPDLGFVIHYQMPGSVVAYYQQVGRAGRALDGAYGVLLHGREDAEITDWFVRSAFPTKDEVATVLEILGGARDGLSIDQLMAQMNLSKGRIAKTVQLLSLETPAPVVKQGSRWELTTASLPDAFWRRAERLTELRQNERQQMQDYVALPFGRHMAFLVEALDGDARAVRPPNLPPLPTQADPRLVQEAVAFLRRTSLPIEPRKQWPAGGLPQYRASGRIDPGLRAEEGRALSVWGDAGWGGLVGRGKFRDGRFDDALVTACAAMVRDWRPQPAPAWVTPVPSARHPDLVPDFAGRLAAAMRLPFHPVLAAADMRPEQKTMANSVQQARNVDGALALTGAPVSQGPVLLIDDMVDSRWTFTVGAWLLRRGGSGPVFPLALARTGQDDD